MLERAREKLSDWIDAGKLRLYLHDFSANGSMKLRPRACKLLYLQLRHRQAA
jgi:hypothetical protein